MEPIDRFGIQKRKMESGEANRVNKRLKTIKTESKSETLNNLDL